MLRFKLTLGVLVALIVGATTMQYTRSAWDPQPKPLALVDSAYHPINKTPHISYAGSGRRPDVMRAIMGMGGISLQGPGASSSSPTFYNDMYLNHTGATGVTCHWDANVDNNWLYLDCGLRLTSNMFMDTGTIGAAGAMTLNPATTFAVHGSNFDVTAAGVVSTTGTVNVGANLLARSALFTQFSVGTVGNAYLNVDTNGITGGIFGTVNQSLTFNGTMTANTTIANSGADTTEDNLQTYALPASTLNVNNYGLRYTAWGDGVSTTDVTTIKCYFGATVVATKVLTASQANTWRMQFEVMRTGGSNQIATSAFWNGGTAASLTQSNSAPAENLGAGITIKCTGQRATSSVANSLRQLGGVLESIH